MYPKDPGEAVIFSKVEIDTNVNGWLFLKKLTGPAVPGPLDGAPTKVCLGSARVKLRPLIFPK
jgi:hypothetical protein